MRDDERSALNREICRDEHSRQLLVWLVAYEEFSSQVSSTAFPTTVRNELQTTILPGPPEPVTTIRNDIKPVLLLVLFPYLC